VVGVVEGMTTTQKLGNVEPQVGCKPSTRGSVSSTHWRTGRAANNRQGTLAGPLPARRRKRLLSSSPERDISNPVVALPHIFPYDSSVVLVLLDTPTSHPMRHRWGTAETRTGYPVAFFAEALSSGES